MPVASSGSMAWTCLPSGMGKRLAVWPGLGSALLPRAASKIMRNTSFINFVCRESGAWGQDTKKPLLKEKQHKILWCDWSGAGVGSTPVGLGNRLENSSKRQIGLNLHPLW